MYGKDFVRRNKAHFGDLYILKGSVQSLTFSWRYQDTFSAKKITFACQKQNIDVELPYLFGVIFWGYLSPRFCHALFFFFFFMCVNLMQVYQEKGMRDKERYRTELMEYKSNNSTPNAQ